MNPGTTEVKAESVLPQEKVDTTLSQQKVETNPTQNEPETDKEINWKKFKDERKRERELSEANAKKAADKETEVLALKAAMDAILNKPIQRQDQQTNQNFSANGYENEEESEDQRIEKKVQAALLKREAEADKRRNEKEQAEFPQRLNQNHSDFNQVCNTENLDYLEYHYPEVAQAFRHMPDGYDKWSTIYKAVKRFVPNTDTRKDAAKVEKNLGKPQSLSSPGTTQGGNAMPGARLDEAKKAENWARMQKALKGLS